jgi:hypothetical protein
MKIFVFTYDRYNSISTSQLLEDENIDHIVLCHTEEQKERFIAGGRVKAERLVVTNKPKGLAYNRNFALDMMEDGEWAIFLVDDLNFVTELHKHEQYVENYIPIDFSNQGEWKFKFVEPLTMKGFVKRSQELVDYCEEVKSNLGGWCGIDNPVYRAKHYTYNTLADGRAWVVKKTHLRFDENVQLIDDLCWTALNIKEFGITVVNQWVLPDCKRYTAGSFGSIEQRLPQKLKEASYLVETYPELIMFRKKAGWPEGSHVVLRPQKKPAWLSDHQLCKMPSKQR